MCNEQRWHFYLYFTSFGTLLWTRAIRTSSTYLRPRHVRFLRLPMDWGSSLSSLCWRWSVCKEMQFPISSVSTSKWLWATSSVPRRVSSPIPDGSSLILFSLSDREIKFWEEKHHNHKMAWVTPGKSCKYHQKYCYEIIHNRQLIMLTCFKNKIK